MHLLLVLLIFFSSCEEEKKPDCSPNFCSDLGTCKITARGDSYCDCDPGFILGEEEFTCIENTQNDKPIIYLYPQQKTTVTVAFAEPDQIELTHTYPKYPKDGWKVIARPDSTLEDPQTGRTYYALYWEGYHSSQIDINSGFVVKGENTIEFLEEKLEILGLNQFEANEFIIYWLPQLEANDHNFIHFATKRWSEAVKLEVNPKPDTSIRIMMLWHPVERDFQIPRQSLEKAPPRQGFTLVEWGGSQLFTPDTPVQK